MPSNDDKKRVNATDASKAANLNSKTSGSKTNYEENSKKRVSGENGQASKKSNMSRTFQNKNIQKDAPPKINSPQKAVAPRSPMQPKLSVHKVAKSPKSVQATESLKPTESTKSNGIVGFKKPKSLTFEEFGKPDLPTALPTGSAKSLDSEAISQPETSVQLEAEGILSLSTNGPKWAMLRSEQQLQKPVSMYDYPTQRSTSAIDFKHYKQGHFYNASVLSSPKKQPALRVDITPSKEIDLQSRASGSVRIITAGNGGCYYTVESRDPKSANLRVFSTIMLNAWRKRRSEVKQLMSERDELKRGTTKSKNQLHVMTTLYRMEAKRNDELRLQLKNWTEEAHLHKTCCEDLKGAISRSKAENEELKQQLEKKEYEMTQDVNSSLKQVKLDLNEALRIQSELEADLSAELLNLEKSQLLTNDLLRELNDLDNDVIEMEARYDTELSAKSSELAQAQAKLNMLNDKLNEMKIKEHQFQDYIVAEAKLKKEIDSLKVERKTLQYCLAATLGNRFKTCWKNSLEYQKTTFDILHWFAFYMLPATPPPKMTSFPIRLSLEKAMGVLKR